MASEPTSIFDLFGRGRNKTPGALYYVSSGVGGPIKIGFTTGFAAISERLRGLQTGSPYHLIALAVRAGTVADEQALHVRFADTRLRGEWFMRSPPLLRHISGVQRRKDCQQWLPTLATFRAPEQIVVKSRGGPHERRQLAMFGPYGEPNVRII